MLNSLCPFLGHDLSFYLECLCELCATYSIYGKRENVIPCSLQCSKEGQQCSNVGQLWSVLLVIKSVFLDFTSHIQVQFCILHVSYYCRQTVATVLPESLNLLTVCYFLKIHFCRYFCF